MPTEEIIQSGSKNDCYWNKLKDSKFHLNHLNYPQNLETPVSSKVTGGTSITDEDIKNIKRVKKYLKKNG